MIKTALLDNTNFTNLSDSQVTRIGLMLRTRREDFAWRQDNVAFHLVTSVSKVIAIEQGDRAFFDDNESYVRVLRRYCDFMNVRIAAGQPSSSMQEWDFRLTGALNGQTPDRRRSIPWDFDDSTGSPISATKRGSRSVDGNPPCPICNDTRDNSVVRLERSTKVRIALLDSRKYCCYRCGLHFIRFLGLNIIR